MSKCVFFDIDGTLLDLKKGIPSDVPPALQALRDNGHLVFLCTGRSRCLVPPEAVALPLDGIIASLGAYIEYRGEPLFRRQASPAVARRAVEIIRAGGMVPVLEGDEYMYFDETEYTAEIDWFAPYIKGMLGEHHKPITGNEDDLRMNIIGAKRQPGCREDWVCEQLAEDFDAIRHEADGITGRTVELALSGCSKGRAIHWICDYLGVDMADTVAFGDSNNDLVMLKTVHTGVAMGNATPALQAAADYVTADLFQQGISKALCHFGLIEKEEL